MPRHLPITFALLLAAACGDDADCPDGSVETDGRCIGIDVGADAGDTGTADTGAPDAGDTGTPDTTTDGSACTTACTDPTPLCDEEGAQGPVGGCVACLGEDDCTGDTPYCDAGFCVACTAATADDDCDATAPVCGTDGACTGCTAFADCARFPLIAACAMSGDQAGQCVQCTADDQCTGVDAAQCDLMDGSATLNTCVACDNSTQCEGILVDGEPVPICLLEGDAAGSCVECTEATAEDDCGDFSCDPATNSCTTTERDSVGDCGRCVSDDECSNEEDRCVPTSFMGEPRPSGHCLRLASETCERPYGTFITAESLSGEPETMYCGIDEDSTTCDAVRALRDSAVCPGGMATECADAGAVCAMVGALANRCTIPCGTPDDCPPTGSSSTCAASHCGSL